MEISAKELRQKTRLLLDAVERGEEVTITYRGRARARVVRMESGSDRGFVLIRIETRFNNQAAGCRSPCFSHSCTSPSSTSSQPVIMALTWAVTVCPVVVM